MSSDAAQKIQEKLKEIGLPYREIKVYGSQITVECVGEQTADRWRSVLVKFAKIRGMIRSWVEIQENRGTVMCPTKIQVWRVYAQIGQKA